MVSKPKIKNNRASVRWPPKEYVHTATQLQVLFGTIVIESSRRFSSFSKFPLSKLEAGYSFAPVVEDSLPPASEFEPPKPPEIVLLKVFQHNGCALARPYWIAVRRLPIALLFPCQSRILIRQASLWSEFSSFVRLGSSEDLIDQSRGKIFYLTSRRLDAAAAKLDRDLTAANNHLTSLYSLARAQNASNHLSRPRHSLWRSSSLGTRYLEPSLSFSRCSLILARAYTGRYS